MLPIFVVAVLAFGDPSGPIPLTPAARVTVGSSIHFVSKDPAELERQVRNSFDLTDRNRDGYIDLSEAPIAERGRQNANGDRIADEAGNGLWIRTMDRDGDGRVDWSEMRGYLLPRYLRANGL